MATFYLTYDDDGPDDKGRRSFTVTWVDHDGEFRRDGLKDGKPAGRCRGQCFRTVPDDFVRRSRLDGHDVVFGPMPNDVREAARAEEEP